MIPVLRSGIRGGLIELRLAFSGVALAGQLFWPAATLVALFLLRGRGASTLPGVLGMFVAFGMMLMVQYLPADRDDGTLLRARATPDGVRSYLIGRLLTASASVLIYLLVVAVPGLFIVRDIAIANTSWPTLAWVLALGLLSTQLIGAVLGALAPGPRAAGFVALPVLALPAISGIFVPITALPGWVQTVAQVFPVYWLGLGMRSALLPGSAAVAEIAGSWRRPQTAAVLGAWALAGLVAGPFVLRRMARRASGSRIAGRRAAG
jgi:ABC-2 type transport system permease protein